MAVAVIGFAGLANPVTALASSVKGREDRSLSLSLSRSALVGGKSGSELRSRSIRRTASGGASRNGLVDIRCVSISKDAPTITSNGLPVREIPGTYGLPFFGAIKDKLDFYWFEQPPNFYDNRVNKYKSTVYRVNTVPGPPGFPDPRVIVLLDLKSFPTLFDTDKVEKRDVFTGTYRPDIKYNGGYRILPYLDPSEEKHKLLKGFCFELLKSSGRRVFPEFHKAMSELFQTWETGLKNDGKIDFNKDLPLATMRFNVKAFLNVDPVADVEASLGKSKLGAVPLVKLWILPQLAPIFTSPGIPKLLVPLAELLLHTFPLPFFLFRSRYAQITAFFKAHSGELLDIAEKQFGLSRDEALHNLVFFTLFNSWGGIDILFPSVVKRLASTSAAFQRELSAEVKKAIKDNGGLNPAALSAMPLLQSAVYEVFRIDPPVPYQYGRAKKDLIVESHDAAFRVKKGEMLAGYMPTACKDPKIFTDPKTYNPKRFLGEEGQKLIKHVLWSNGPETEVATLQNKQCAGKNFIVTIAQLFVAEIYSTYQTIQLEGGNLTSLKRAEASS